MEFYYQKILNYLLSKGPTAHHTRSGIYKSSTSNKFEKNYKRNKICHLKSKVNRNIIFLVLLSIKNRKWPLLSIG